MLGGGWWELVGCLINVHRESIGGFLTVLSTHLAGVNSSHYLSSLPPRREGPMGGPS